MRLNSKPHFSPFLAASTFAVRSRPLWIECAADPASCLSTALTSLSCYKWKIVPFLIPCFYCCQMGGFPRSDLAFIGPSQKVACLLMEMFLRIPVVALGVLSSLTLTAPPRSPPHTPLHSQSRGRPGRSPWPVHLFWKSILCFQGIGFYYFPS